MKIPDLPVNEETRLKSLRSLNIMDTPFEERFDRLTRLAKRLYDVPISLVSLLDDRRQWFKSSEGMNVRETPREISFCGHAILGDELFIVNDTTTDERFSDSPLVLQEPYIRFYAGCPLRYLDGSKLGTLCIIDTKPRTLTEDDLESLKDLAALVERELVAVQLARLDDLTQISNRRGFIVLAQQALKMCVRQKMPASLVFFDLNGFKLINDQFGHAEGDNALISIAKIMGEVFRDSDVFGRIGGDEFVVLLTNTTIDKAEESVGRLRLAVDTFFKQADNGYHLDFCEGIVACSFDKNCSIEVLLSAADTLMYEKKGRKLL